MKKTQPSLTRKIPPGPRGTFIVGSLRELRKDPLKMLSDAAHEYGEMVRFRVGPREVFLLNDPYYIQHVLQTNHKNYRKGLALVRAKSLLGEGLLTSEGDLWLHQRRLAQPAFHRQHIATFGQMMSHCTLEMLNKWQPAIESQTPIDVTHEMMGLTLNIVCETLFNTGITPVERETVSHAMDIVLRMGLRNVTRPPMLQKFPTSANRRVNEAIRQLDAIVYRLIAEKRQVTGATGDLISMLMVAEDEVTGERMNDRQLRDEIMTIFLAGHETTANALTWMWILLAEHQIIAETLRNELANILQGRLPTMDDLPQLPYTQAIIQEVMRLYPPAWAITRQAIGEDEIGGYTIPAGSSVIMSPYVMHRNPTYWENPAKFDPARFLDEKRTWRPQFTYFPFGGGPRQCIGMNFALMEAQLVLALIAGRYQLRLVSEQVVEPEALITLRPRHEVLMTAERV